MSNDLFGIGTDEKKISKLERKTEWVGDAIPIQNNNEEYLTSNFDLKKLRLLFYIISLTFIIILFRVGYLQMAKGVEYRSAAEENRIRIVEIKAPRGIIYDRDLTVLAYNIPNFSLSITPADFPDEENKKIQIIEKISDILTIDASDLLTQISEIPDYSYESFILADHIPYEQAMLLKIASSDLPGITLDASTFREYINNTLFSHTLGYMGKISPDEMEKHPDYSFDDYIGKSGVELFYEDVLRGTHGKKEIEVDSLGKESKIITESKPEQGKNIILTIDSDIQNTLGQELNALVEKSQTITGAAAAAIDPQNGEVLALVSSPTFDNNSFTAGLTPEQYADIANNPDKPLYNRAIAGEYPSGSTIKPLIALAGLQDGIINEHTSFLSTGGIKIDKWFFPDWKAGGHGQTDVKKAISESVNTFFYLVGGGDENIQGLGVNRIRSYLELFGLNDALGIDIPGEATGFLPTKEWKQEVKNEPWYIGDTYHLSIGQGDILVTPLQVATYTAIVANSGTFYKPHLLKSYSDATNQNVEEIDPTIIRDNFINDYYYKIVQDGLREAVLSGSSSALGDLPFSSAGKTGTAQFGSEGKTHAWFTCFAPFEDPNIAITVVVESGGEGHATALPVAKEGLKKWYEKYK
ncbi:penicillin-binding protein 2 [Patescibacteria group bacterium]|nr:penicillin-binding protein 2 [Patescibacteria group bacterium]